jgi:hypothetical protein
MATTAHHTSRMGGSATQVSNFFSLSLSLCSLLIIHNYQPVRNRNYKSTTTTTDGHLHTTKTRMMNRGFFFLRVIFNYSQLDYVYGTGSNVGNDDSDYEWPPWNSVTRTRFFFFSSFFFPTNYPQPDYVDRTGTTTATLGWWMGAGPGLIFPYT